MEHTDLEATREGKIKEALCAGRNAAIRHRLQPADVDACSVDFSIQMASPGRLGRWESVDFADAWLQACAGNFAKNYLARMHSIYLHEVPEDPSTSRLEQIVEAAADPARELVCHEHSKALESAIARLNERQKIAIVLCFFEDRDISEVARALQVTKVAARKIIGRALVAVRGRLIRCAFEPNEALRDYSNPPHAAHERAYSE